MTANALHDVKKTHEALGCLATSSRSETEVCTHFSLSASSSIRAGALQPHKAIPNSLEVRKCELCCEFHPKDHCLAVCFTDPESGDKLSYYVRRYPKTPFPGVTYRLVSNPVYSFEAMRTDYLAKGKDDDIKEFFKAREREEYLAHCLLERKLQKANLRAAVTTNALASMPDTYAPSSSAGASLVTLHSKSSFATSLTATSGNVCRESLESSSALPKSSDSKTLLNQENKSNVLDEKRVNCITDKELSAPASSSDLVANMEDTSLLKMRKDANNSSSAVQPVLANIFEKDREIERLKSELAYKSFLLSAAEATGLEFEQKYQNQEMTMATLGEIVEELQAEINHLRQHQFPEDLSRYFSCPITMEIMKDPVIAPSGFTYEREGLMRWLSSHPSDPLTRQALVESDLVENRALKEIISVWKAKSGGAGAAPRSTNDSNFVNQESPYSSQDEDYSSSDDVDSDEEEDFVMIEPPAIPPPRTVVPAHGLVHGLVHSGRAPVGLRVDAPPFHRQPTHSFHNFGMQPPEPSVPGPVGPASTSAVAAGIPLAIPFGFLPAPIAPAYLGYVSLYQPL